MREMSVPSALKHGAYSELVMLPGEDPAAFEALKQSLFDEYKPSGPSEESTMTSIAKTLWQLQRLGVYEHVQYLKARGNRQGKDGPNEAIKKFMADYKAEYGHDPENAFAALGYDTVNLLVDAIKRAGGTDSAAVKSAIESTKDFKGITGAITFSPDSHVPQKGVTVIAVKDGKFTLGGEVVPESVPKP